MADEDAHMSHREEVALQAFTEAAQRWDDACEGVEKAIVNLSKAKDAVDLARNEVAQAKLQQSQALNAKARAEVQRNRDIREAFREGVTADVIGDVLGMSRTMVYRILGG